MEPLFEVSCIFDKEANQRMEKKKLLCWGWNNPIPTSSMLSLLLSQNYKSSQWSLESLFAAQQIFDKEESYSTLYIAYRRTSIFRSYLWITWRILREEEIPPTTLGISYKSSRHECPKAFHTWGLDLARPIHSPLNGYIQVFAAIK